MDKAYIIMRVFSDSNTHESDSKPVLVCATKFKASIWKQRFESANPGCWYEILEVKVDL